MGSRVFALWWTKWNPLAGRDANQAREGLHPTGGLLQLLRLTHFLAFFAASHAQT